VTAPRSQPEHQASHQQGHHGPDPAQARVLDLDAEVLARHTAAIISWLPVRTAPMRIVDLGAGTGAGTFALLRQFPHAHVTAVDSSAEHLELLQARARFEGFGNRVSIVQADLDATRWPDLGAIDLVWASASLHHLVDPDRALRTVRDLLQPDGLLAVVELSGLPRFLPPTAPEDRPGLEERCHAATQHLMAAHMPHRGADWEPKLNTAGLVVEDKFTINAEVSSTHNDAVGPYALAALQGLRNAAAPHLPADDLAALDQLLDTTSPRSILRRPDLVARTTRTVWAARRSNHVTDRPSEWFSAAAEAANCERVLGNRRHGLDTLPTKKGTKSSPS
jgi:SAM-dependent methyltransferase